MSLLAETFPGLHGLPQVPLVLTPSPVRPLELPFGDSRAGLWCKRDDLGTQDFGGNKLRKLEWLLGDARFQRADCLVTAGAAGSNHVLATSLFGRRHGFAVEAVVLEDDIPGHDSDADDRCLKAGARLHREQGYTTVARRLVAVQARVRREGGRVYRIGPGGTSPVGTLGYVEAALELGAQVREGACPQPQAIYVAAGTGGTAAGLAIGLVLAGLSTDVVAVRVAHRVAINRISIGRLVRRTEALLQRADSRIPRFAKAAMAKLKIDNTQAGGGYGHATDEGRTAVTVGAKIALPLETTYTGKAFAAFCAASSTTEGHLLYWHTRHRREDMEAKRPRIEG